MAELLGLGPVLVLTAWTLLGLSQGKDLTDSTVSGFGLITVVAALVGGAGWWSTRQVLRRGARPERVASTVAVAALAFCGFTWAFSYAIDPWTTPAEVLRRRRQDSQSSNITPPGLLRAPPTTHCALKVLHSAQTPHHPCTPRVRSLNFHCNLPWAHGPHGVPVHATGPNPRRPAYK